MKRILFILFSVACWSAHAANPSFGDFNANQFGVTGNKVVIKSGGIVTNLAVSGIMTATELDVATIVTTNGLSFSDTLVASLGTPTAGTFPIKYSSDVITSKGSGGYVRWDGTQWMTWENVPATSDATQFILNSVSSRLTSTTAKSSVLCSPFMADGSVLTSGLGFFGTGVPRGFSGTGSSSSGLFIVRSYGGMCAVNTGTLTNSYGIIRGPTEYLSTGDLFACGGSYSVNNACDATEIYSTAVGIVPQSSVTFPTDGAFFLYDMMNTWTNGIAATNNWICITAKASVWTRTDSGLPVRVSSSAMDALGIILTTTGCKFYTNGVLAVTHDATTCPPSGTVLAVSSVQQMKRNGTGILSRVAYEARPWVHLRYATARTYP